MSDALTRALRRYVRAEIELGQFLHGHKLEKLSRKHYQQAFDAAEKEVDEALAALPLELVRAIR